ncbi:MAG: hypothetical protein K0S01_66 [Herbinix sp.]|jgi:ABC-type Fe3+ transport system substrate-binding protein|nr:hypothetical protein [Herbinix sp.]
MPKQTRLDENAVIYQPRSEISEKEKLRDMSFSNKLSYLWEYYKIHALVSIGAIALASYFIYSIVTPNIEPQFYAVVINNTIADDVIEKYQADFADYLQLDPKTESIDINAAFNFNGTDEYSMNMNQVLSTYVAAAQVDVIIAPESEMASYAYNGYLDKLSDQLPTDIYSSLTDNFYLSDLEEDPEKNVYGIYLTNTKLFADNANNEDPYVIGIVSNSKHKENAVEFIRYLFNDKQ